MRTIEVNKGTLLKVDTKAKVSTGKKPDFEIRRQKWKNYTQQR